MTPISLIVAILIFAIIAYGLFWVCDKAGFPQPVRWVVGAVLLIVLLSWAANVAGVNLNSWH